MELQNRKESVNLYLILNYLAEKCVSLSESQCTVTQSSHCPPLRCRSSDERSGSRSSALSCDAGDPRSTPLCHSSSSRGPSAPASSSSSSSDIELNRQDQWPVACDKLHVTSCLIPGACYQLPVTSCLYPLAIPSISIFWDILVVRLPSWKVTSTCTQSLMSRNILCHAYGYRVHNPTTLGIDLTGMVLSDKLLTSVILCNTVRPPTT